MKKIIIALAATMLMGTTALAADVKVEVNGTSLDTEARIVNDRTLVPLRAVSNALGCGVAWNPETRGITIVRAGEDIENEIYMLLSWIDKPRAFKLSGPALDGGTVMDVAPQIIDDRTFVPIRAIAEMFGAEVSWVDETKTAVITAQMPALIYEDATAEELIDYEKAMDSVYDAYDKYLSGETKKTNAVITLEDESKIELELYPELAPITVANFVSLAKSNFYDGLTFHRVIEDFMIQGGGYDVEGHEHGIDLTPIKGEFLYNGVVNFLPHNAGAISMARTNVNDSATGQFFIVHKASPHLNANYAAFGNVTSGIEIVDKIAKVETDAADKPIEDIIIKSIEIK